MDNEIKGLEDCFVARHTTDPELRFRLLSTTNRPTGRLTEHSVQAVLLPAAPFVFCVVESMGSTNNSPAALEQGVVRASSLMHRVMEERAEQERWRREMNRREREIRTQRAREKRERETREVVEANEWPQQQRAITGPGCTSLHELIARNTICGNCGRQKYISSGSEASINLGLTETQRPTLGQCVEEACPLVQRVHRIREEREQFGREIERKEREIREQKARKKREREARKLEETSKWPQQPEASEWPQQPEASEWPQQQEAITGPWCVCANEVREAAQGSEQSFEALSPGTTTGKLTFCSKP